MRKNLAAAVLVLAFASCGPDGATIAKFNTLQVRNDELSQQVTKLEKRLDDAEKQLVQQQQALQVLNDRLKTAEASIDKLAVQSVTH
jgi:septal ring factor EnvC (AmiA/AmiB activator)